MDVPGPMIFWILDYLTTRSQFVRVQSISSNIVSSSTGAPQGTVLAPFLFTLYTSDCRPEADSCPIVKFADDTAMVGLITNDDSSQYVNEINRFLDYCQDNFLELNVSKTKELVIDFRTNKCISDPIVISDSPVERVHTYKYLGVVVNDKLSWSDNIDLIMSKLNSRLYCLRKLKLFHVEHTLLSLFYRSVITSIFTYCIVCWGGSITEQDKKRINSIIRKSERLIGNHQQPLDSFYNSCLQRKLRTVLDDADHPLHSDLVGRFTGRSGRMRPPAAGTNRYKHSFVPMAVTHFNNTYTR